MHLKTVTYTSLAALDLTEEDVVAIHQSSARANALEGMTGLLIFNGTHFLQIVEGSSDAIDDLLDRLHRDSRHHGIEIRDERLVDERAFGDWAMEMVRVKSRYYEAREQIAVALPAELPQPVSDRIFRMTQAISGTVALPD
ncbi:MAG TPA: BLUF domain-containing protein [Sphingomicrobium sp.]|nr:BLUF domain-containing protein [Sphingomicrobium sp.]